MVFADPAGKAATALSIWIEATMRSANKAQAREESEDLKKQRKKRITKRRVHVEVRSGHFTKETGAIELYEAPIVKTHIICCDCRKCTRTPHKSMAATLQDY